MARGVRVAIVLSVFVVTMAIALAKSFDGSILDEGPIGQDDDTPLSFWTTVGLAAYVAVLPLALIWFLVLLAYLVRRVRTPRQDD